MVKHIILWTLHPQLNEQQKQEIRCGIRQGLESLQGQIPGLLDIHVQTERLASSNADVMLDATFENEASLQAYATHPAHVAVAETKVRPYTEQRSCIDFEV